MTQVAFESKDVGLRVLICDDERHIVRLIGVNLERQGCAVMYAYGGREAIDGLKEQTFDLAVVDRDMPDVDGLQVLDWIRANERTRLCGSFCWTRTDQAAGTGRARVQGRPPGPPCS